MYKHSMLLLFVIVSQMSITACKDGNPTKTNQGSGRPLKILAIGDSNGALKDGWINQLKKIRPNDTIYNISISGNTIGYNNLGRSSLNTLDNIGSYMDKAYRKLEHIDQIIIMLGTNDCKAVFKDSLSYVPENMRKLIIDIKTKTSQHKENPVIFIVSPPPFGSDEMLGEKYTGGLERVTQLNEQLEKIAKEENVMFVDSFHILLPVFKNVTIDGVHLNPDGQMMIALIIRENMKYFFINN
jgi:lysophospholipase L1-like esterase